MAVADIIVSPAQIWYAPVGTAFPDETTDPPGTWPVGWVNLGTTLEPISLSYETEIFELEVQQSTAPVRRVRQKETAMIETVLAEITGKNLQLVTDGLLTSTAAAANQHGFDEVKAGGKVDLSSYAFGFEGIRVTDANDRLPVRFFFYRATAILNGELTFAKDAGAGIPMQASAIADTTKPAGQQLLVMHNVHTKKTS